MNTKTRSDAFSQKISEEQRAQLIHWLAEHTYDDVLALIKAEPPDGFGMEISKPTLSRFFHEFFYEIDKLRQERIHNRVVQHCSVVFPDPDGIRNFLHEGAALRLQEHLCDLLSQPVTSVSELKALASISKTITELNVNLADPQKREQLMSDITSFFTGANKHKPASSTGS
jgi:hypothetical protein